MQPTTFIVDSFTSEPFKGNPAGVCLSDHIMATSRMQAIATELNLSETAFVVRHRENGPYSIRYFSPKMEIPLCGHATLAASKVLFETSATQDIQFLTGEGLQLPISKVENLIEMEFPVYDLHAAIVPTPLLAALGLSDVLFCGYNSETNSFMLEVSTTYELADLRPDFLALLKSHNSIHGVSVTAQADDTYDFHSRYFWPWSGTEEDPVTGVTHTFLAKYWGHKLGKSIMRSFQSSRRTGEMEVEVTSDNRLFIRGNAVIVFQGVLAIS